MRAENVVKRFGRLEVLKGVSLKVEPREVVCIIGPSGSGKTTFIRCINHLEKIDAGRIEVNGHLIGYRERNGRLVEDTEQNIARQRAEIGMVFQRFNLFPHKTALGNVIEAPRPSSSSTTRRTSARSASSRKSSSSPRKSAGFAGMMIFAGS
jgi:polar amino acid transport system ATP-binding protein